MGATAFVIVFFTIKGMVQEPTLYPSKQECLKAAAESDKKGNKTRSCFEVLVTKTGTKFVYND